MGSGQLGIYCIVLLYSGLYPDFRKFSGILPSVLFHSLPGFFESFDSMKSVLSFNLTCDKEIVITNIITNCKTKNKEHSADTPRKKLKSIFNNLWPSKKQSY